MQAAGAVFGVLLAGNLVVALAQSRANPLHPLDLLLLTNFVTANGSFRQSESFSPVCLPRFNSSGFLHAYINYISQVKLGANPRDPEFLIRPLLSMGWIGHGAKHAS